MAMEIKDKKPKKPLIFKGLFLIIAEGDHRKVDHKHRKNGYDNKCYRKPCPYLHLFILLPLPPAQHADRQFTYSLSIPYLWRGVYKIILNFSTRRLEKAHEKSTRKYRF